MTHVLIIGAGGVGRVVAHKCAQHNDELGDITLASRSVAKCERIADDVRGRGSPKNATGRFQTRAIDASKTADVGALIRETGADIVINVASPYCNLAIMEACLANGAHYLDSAVYEREGETNMPPPWYANYEWPYREEFVARGLTGILGMGFDPGAVNVFCAYAQRHLVDSIDSIDIMDVNGGDHGRYFATNFDPETNLREIAEDVIYWEDGDWRRVPCHSRSRDYDFPALGRHKLYSMGHDEIHSLAVNIPARRIEFWMGFGERYLQVFEVLHRLGLLSSTPVTIDGCQIRPLQVVKALLPDPASLAADYTGQVCVGCLVRGHHCGRPRGVFIYSTCEHQAAYREVGAQAISYTTGVPLVTAALLIARGDWNVGRLVNAEELAPEPFLQLMPQLGIGWDYRQDGPD